jgi:high-affinity Fe2+/Pb2+ permease
MEFLGFGVGTFLGTALGFALAWMLTWLFPDLENETLFLASIVLLGFVVGLVSDAVSRRS